MVPLWLTFPNKEKTRPFRRASWPQAYVDAFWTVMFQARAGEDLVLFEA